MKSMLSKLKNEQGQSAVEFALVAILLFLLVFGIMEFGRAWFHADVLKGYANTAARTYAVKGAAAALTMEPFWIDEALKKRNMTITINFTCMDALGNSVSCGAITMPLPDSVTATVIEPQFKVVAGLLTIKKLNNIPITRTATYRLE